MRYLFLFIIVLSAFVSCGEDGEKNVCDYIVCDEWESCNTSNKRCELKEGRCSINDDCEENYFCNSENVCEEFICEEDENQTIECGINNNGMLLQKCVANNWINDGVCDDICLIGGTQLGETVCGLNNEGFYVQNCIEGQWVDDDETCSGSDECVNGVYYPGVTLCDEENQGYFERYCENGQFTDTQSCKSFFVTTWKTDNGGLTTANQIKIPINPDYSYAYSVDCNSDGVWEAINVHESYICEYENPGTYNVSITNKFPAIYFNNEGDKDKILSIQKWGTNKWDSMKNAFQGCVNLTIAASDNPVLSNVEDMSYMFSGATSVNQPMGSWDVSNVTDMSAMFEFAKAFNQDLSLWNVGNTIQCSYFSYQVTVWTLPKPNFTQCNPN